MSSKKKRVGEPLTLPFAIRSFVGYLEGTEKAAHTIRSYRSDLATFQSYLGETPLSKVGLKDLEEYHEFLKKEGMSTNTRRRKVLTSRRLLAFLHQRGKLSIDISGRVPAPYKVERVPQVFDTLSMIERVRALPSSSPIEARNRVLLWFLAETGAQVSEVSRIRFDEVELVRGGKEAWLSVSGKAPRRLPLSPELAFEVEHLRLLDRKFAWVFTGFTRQGSLGTPITDRGVELLVRAAATRLNVPKLTPRLFRHSAVVLWNRQGLSRDQIRERLGLKTEYAFRAYEPLFKLDPVLLSV